MSTPLRLVLQPLAGDAPEIVVLRDAEGLYRIESVQERSRVDGSTDGRSIKLPAKLLEDRFESIEELEAEVATALTRRRPPVAASKVTKMRARQQHPQWMNPEMAKLLDENGYRHNVVGGFYFADGDCLITETQLLVSKPDGIRKLIAKQRAKPPR